MAQGARPQRAQPADAAAGPSTSVNGQPAQRASSAPAEATGTKPVKRLHSPTEEASQKLQRRGSGGGPALGTAVGAHASEPPRVPFQPCARAVTAGGRSDGLPAPTVNGVPASPAGATIVTSASHLPGTAH